MPGVRIALRGTKPDPLASPPRTLGERIRRRRLELGLRQVEAAPLLGVNEFTVVHWERGQTEPKLRYLPKVYAFLGEDPEPAG